MSTVSTNMALQIPDVGDSDYATSISTSLTNIDDHDHSSGNGVQIPTGGIADLSVTSAKLSAASVTSGKPALSSTDNSTLEVSGGVYRVKDAGITKAKLAALGQQSNTVASLQTITSATYVDVTNLTATITTSGRPVMICLFSTTQSGTLGIVANGGASPKFKILRDATAIMECSETVSATGDIMNYSFVDIVAAGTYVYKLQALVSSGIGSLDVYQGNKIVVYEL